MPTDPLDVATISQLLALLAHDLRNPLAILSTNLGFVGTTLSGDDADLAEAMTDATASCAALERLVANLDVIALTLRGEPPPPETLSLRRATSEAMGRVKSHADSLRVGLELHDDDEEGLSVKAQPLLWARALDNLLANAVQYAKPGDVVRVEVGARDERGVVTVVDAGPIVPEAEREDVLSAGGQMRAKGRLEARYGRGVGLYVAAVAARAAGADVSVGERGACSAFELGAPLATRRGR